MTREKDRPYVEKIAYRLWEEAGRPPGDGKEFWFRAEQDFDRAIKRAYWLLMAVGAGAGWDKAESLADEIMERFFPATKTIDLEL